MRTVFVVLLAVLVSGGGWAQDDIQAVGAVWSDFVSSLRRGDYVNAHGLFSPGSRGVMSYGEFVEEYGPLSAAREMVLAKPESLSTSLDEDWGEITYGGTNPGTGRKFRVGVSFVRNRGVWGLVAARNEGVERVEAGVRGLLRLVWGARGRGGVRELVSALNEAHAGNPVLGFYRIETDGSVVRAFPLRGGLRTFYLDGSGVVRAMGEESGGDEGRRERVPEGGVGVVAAGGDEGMPEMAEPGVRGGVVGGGLDGELAEPPMRSGRGGGRVVERPDVSLPDQIR